MKLIALLMLGLLYEYGANGQYFGAEKFLNKYSRYRFTFDCLGYANMRKESLEIIDAFAECFLAPNAAHRDHCDNKTASTNSSKREDKQSPGKTPYLSKPLYPEILVRFIKNEAVERQNIFSCVLKKMKLIDENDKLQFENFVRRIKAFQLDSKLEEDILEGFNYCMELSAFSASVKLPSAISPNYKQVMAFTNCKEELTAIACLKKDIRYTEAEYELAGLDGFMSDLPTDERILGIVWSNLMMNAMTKEQEVIF